MLKSILSLLIYFLFHSLCISQNRTEEIILKPFNAAKVLIYETTDVIFYTDFNKISGLLNNASDMRFYENSPKIYDSTELVDYHKNLELIKKDFLLHDTVNISKYEITGRAVYFLLFELLKKGEVAIYDKINGAGVKKVKCTTSYKNYHCGDYCKKSKDFSDKIEEKRFFINTPKVAYLYLYTKYNKQSHYCCMERHPLDYGE